MKITIELKEIKHVSGNEYIASTYPESGIYKFTNAGGATEYVFVNRDTNVVIFLYAGNDLDIFNNIATELEELESPEPISEVVTESFALKMLAIAVNYDNIKDVK